MPGKQIIIDIVVVVFIPLCIIAGYFYWGTEDSQLLSSEQGDVIITHQRGDKVREALATLESITFDDSVFKSPAFKSLEDFQNPVVEVPVGTRSNPFTPSDVVRQKSQQASKAGVKTVTTASNKDIFGKIDDLKKGVR